MPASSPPSLPRSSPANWQSPKLATCCAICPEQPKPFSKTSQPESSKSLPAFEPRTQHPARIPEVPRPSNRSRRRMPHPPRHRTPLARDPNLGPGFPCLPLGQKQRVSPRDPAILTESQVTSGSQLFSLSHQQPARSSPPGRPPYVLSHSRKDHPHVSSSSP